jgi:putative ABC transport system substrate-binding protein
MDARKRHKMLSALMAALLLIGIGLDPVRADEPLIVVVKAKSSGPYEEVLDGFRSCLDDLGIEARLDLHTINGDIETVDRILDGAVSRDAKLVFTIGTAVTERAISENPGIPIVYSLVMDEVQAISADITGVTMEFSVSSHFLWMTRFLPKARRVGVLYNPKNNGERIVRAKVEAMKMGLVLEAEAVDKPQDIPAALERIAKRVDVLWGIPDDVVLNPQTAKQLLLFCYRNRIPFIGPSKAWVKAGALYALDRDYRDIGSQCGEIASSILAGTGPRSINAQSPKRTVYFVNSKTARHMKLNIDKKLLASADGVY